MNKLILIVVLTVLAISASVIAGSLWVDFTKENETPVNKPYKFPILVGDKTYRVSVTSNYSAAPQVSYSELSKAVSVSFKGDKENAFCNITIPTELIWGELSVIDKYYKMSEEQYIQSFNGTHNSIYFTFDHVALLKHFDIIGTQGARAEAPR